MVKLVESGPAARLQLSAARGVEPVWQRRPRCTDVLLYQVYDDTYVQKAASVQ